MVLTNTVSQESLRSSACDAGGGLIAQSIRFQSRNWNQVNQRINNSLIYGESLASLSLLLHSEALSLEHSSSDFCSIVPSAVYSLTFLELAFPWPLHSYDKSDIKLHREFFFILEYKALEWSKERHPPSCLSPSTGGNEVMNSSKQNPDDMHDSFLCITSFSVRYPLCKFLYILSCSFVKPKTTSRFGCKLFSTWWCSGRSENETWCLAA